MRVKFMDDNHDDDECPGTQRKLQTTAISSKVWSSWLAQPPNQLPPRDLLRLLIRRRGRLLLNSERREDEPVFLLGQQSHSSAV